MSNPGANESTFPATVVVGWGRWRTLVGSLLVFALVILLIATMSPPTAAGATGLVGTWYSLLPPLVAIFTAFASKRLIPSMIAAAMVGGIVFRVGPDKFSLEGWVAGLLQGPQWMLSQIWTKGAPNTWNLQLLAFISLMLAMITVMLLSGGLSAVVSWLSRYAKTRRSSQVITAILGFLIFIDDYANTMIVGTSMRPITDSRGTSREKLAFLVDATAAPIAGLAMISTWIGYEIGLFADQSRSLGLQQEGYSMFLDAIGFRYYCLFMVIFVLVNVFSGWDFGPMAKAEQRAQDGHLLCPTARPVTSTAMHQSGPDNAAKANMKAALIPMALLFIFMFAGLWLDGGGLNLLAHQGASTLVSPTAWLEVISHSENNVLVLAVASGVGLLTAMVCARLFSGLPFQRIFYGVKAGFQASLMPVTILILAWTLKAACDSLGTGAFLATATAGAIEPMWFPALVFVLAGATSFAMGTSWGTMAILIPTVIPIAYGLDHSQYGLITMITLGAVLDGAIFGDHCSPISDTTIMSSIATSCDHLHHVRTQMPYAVLVGLVALLAGYLPAGFGLPSWIGLILGTVLIMLVFKLWGRRAL